LLGLLLICVEVAAQTTSPFQAFLSMEAVDSSYKVTYQDTKGKPMTEDAFIAATKSGKFNFDLDRDTAKHTAVMHLSAIDKMQVSAADAAFLKPGQSVPPFKFVASTGKSFDNRSLLGHTTIVSFFFSTCAPCIEETPALTAYAQKHPDDHVLAVTFDDMETARDYIKKRGLSWPVIADASDFIRTMGVETYPALALIGPDGRVRRMVISTRIAAKGGVLTVSDLEHWINQPIAAISK
jgi:peroxiredoxin